MAKLVIYATDLVIGARRERTRRKGQKVLKGVLCVSLWLSKHSDERRHTILTLTI